MEFISQGMMVKRNNLNIFIVDDEPKVREAVMETLEQLNSGVSCFASAEECLEQLGSQRCDLLITDMRMPGMNGIELLKEVKGFAPWLPVLLITGYGDIPTAVTAMKAGAVDFIEKPLDTETLFRKVKSLLQSNAVADFIKENPLTKTEVRILRLVVEGKSSKEIANIIHRSVRTVEVHRSRIMQKLGVNNVIDLVKRAVILGLVDIMNERESK
jgi:two-component system response regulator FixJ